MGSNWIKVFPTVLFDFSADGKQAAEFYRFGTMRIQFFIQPRIYGPLKSILVL